MLTNLRALYNTEINNLFKTDPDYLGTFSKDELYKLYPMQGYMIINSRDLNDPGENAHWCLGYFKSPTTYLFDSFGVPPNEATLYYANHFKYPIIGNNSQYQYLDGSTSCGWYCIYIILGMCQGRTMQNILNDFDPNNTKENEKVLLNFFNHNPEINKLLSDGKSKS
jgi:hypothetical protein